MREFSIGEWQQVREGIHVVQLQPASVTVGLVVGSEGVLLVDTGSSPAQGRELADAAERVAGRPVTHVVVTHSHFDHFFGLAGMPADAITIGHENLANHLGTDDPDVTPELIRDDLGFDISELVAPNTPIMMIKAVDLGDRRAEIVHYGAGHSDSDLFVIIPEQQVVFTGDMVETAGPPMVGPDSHVASWATSLDGVLNNGRPDMLFIPGHGPVASLAEVQNQRAAIALLWETAEEQVRRGRSIEDVVADMNGPREVSWPFPLQGVANALPFLYAELQRAGVTRSRNLPLV